ncbi:MAG: TSUP family transporter [Paracoccaceae bacterium]|nr:TSUP family transporter [Paracoccaceae bacterium]
MPRPAPEVTLGSGQIAALALTFLIAAFVRGYSGFGFSALLIASAGLVTDPRPFMPVAFLCELTMTLVQARGIGPLIDWRRVGTMLLGAAMAMPFSVSILADIGLSQARLAISAGILLFCLLLLTGWTIRSRIGPGGQVGVGLVSGLCNGAAVGGLPVAAFLAAQPIAAPVFRATMVAYLTLIDLIALPLFARAGFVTRATLTAWGLSLPLIALGIWAGGRHFLTASPQSFRRMAIVLLAVLSCLGLLRSMG